MIVSGHDAERDLNEAMVLVNQIPTLWGNSTVSAKPLFHCSLAVTSLSLSSYFMDYLQQGCDWLMSYSYICL